MPLVDFVVGTEVYGGLRIPQACTVGRWKELVGQGLLGEQLLYAERLSCRTEQDGAPLDDEAPMPEPPQRLYVGGPAPVLCMLSMVLRKLTSQADEGGAGRGSLTQKRRSVGGRRGGSAKAVQVSLRRALNGEALAKVRLRPSDSMATLYCAIAGKLEGPHIAAQLLYGQRRLHAYETQAEVGLSEGDFVDVVCRACLVVTGSNDSTAKAWGGDRCSMTMRGHSDSVQCVAATMDGRFVATGSADKTVRLWSTESCKCTRTLVTKGLVHSVAFSHGSGDFILAGSSDRTAVAWSTEDGEIEIVLVGHTNRVYSAAWSPDSHSIATASADGTAKIWDTTIGECMQTLEGHKGVVRSAAFSPDSSTVVTCGWDRTVRLWGTLDGHCHFILRGHSGDVFSALFSPDGGRIVTGSDDHTAKVWSASTGEGALLTLAGHEETVRSAAFSLDGRGIVTASGDGTAKVWDAETGVVALTLQGHGDRVTSAIFAGG
mmetsp:Transcript_20978/g.45724  ORF Transcript_20978/g.45724 Transcript_20978/m.45724 type:complete len:488 (+) Transcript_20978:119-1582(+)